MSHSENLRQRQVAFIAEDDDSLDNSYSIKTSTTGCGDCLETSTTSSTTESLSNSLSQSKYWTFISQKSRNMIVRFVFTIAMISILALSAYLGPLYLVALILFIAIVIYLEVIYIGYFIYKAHNLPGFRTLSAGFFIAINTLYFGESFIDYLKVLLKKTEFMSLFIVHYRFISFSIYCLCVVMFVLTLKKKHYLKQFYLFGWTHVTLLILLTAIYSIILNMFKGMIWFLVPTAAITCNEIMVFVCGSLLGKTPLNKLSTNKTWEGVLGGGLFTIAFGFILSAILIQFDYYVCPLEFDDNTEFLSVNCTRNPLFILQYYSLPNYLNWLPLKLLPWCPYMKHCFFISLFASFVGPFGGLFASGFKRAFKLNNFSGMIPYHGGIADRADCQILMSFFTYVYYQTFVQHPGLQPILKQIFALPKDEQLKFYHILTEGLIRRGLFP